MTGLAKHLCTFLVMIFLGATNIAWSQTDLTGVWQGEISLDYQPKSPWYRFELWLKMEDKKISGSSHVWAFGNHALMELEGEHVKGNVYRIKELRIKDYTSATGWEWCIKTMFLEYSVKKGVPTLEGIWEGYTSFSACKPGKLKVQKKPRA